MGGVWGAGVNTTDTMLWIAYLHITVDFLHRQAQTDMSDLPEVVYNGMVKAQKARIGQSKKIALARLLDVVPAEHPQKAEMLELFARLE